MISIPLLLALYVPLAAPDTDSESGDIAGVDLAELLDFETDVASTSALSQRESPAIITVVTRDEITRVGARDLMDILALIPGVSFGTDVQGVAGIGFRGLWGHEGKVLLMVDGQMMNELLYGTTQFGNHIPAELIERVEIIRGPGSVIYGGFAELAVIDVITRTADSLHGGAVAASYGRMRDTTGRWLGSAGFGQRYGDFEVSANAAFGHGIRSDRILVDANGDSFDLQNGSSLNPGFIDVGASWRGLKARFIYDDYRTTEVAEYGVLAAFPAHVNFRTLRGELRYDWQLTETLTLTPRISYTRQQPWSQSDPNSSATLYDRTVQRLTTGATAVWRPIEPLSVALGGDVWMDHATANQDNDPGGINNFNGRDHIDFTNYIGFAEAIWRTIVNVEGGARVEHHTQFGNSFVPRFALTKVFGDFHVKGLASRAFRAPTIENINTNPNIKPERTTAFELEGGYRISSQFFASVNLFDLTITNPIVYGFDQATQTELYGNVGKLGSRGVESVLRYVHAGSYATLTYSFYTTAGKDTAGSTYAVPGRNDVLLGFPAHKLTLSTSFAITDWLSIGGTANVMSRRYAMFGADSAGNSLPGSYAPRAYLSATVFVHDVGLKGLEGSLSLHNAGDALNPLIQPYDGGQPPYLGPGRELIARVAYAF